MLRTAVALCLFILAASCVAPTDAAEWYRFRGPSGDGHVDAVGLPLQWSSTQNVTWKQAIPGQGWSSPVVSNGRIYLTAAVPLNESAKPDYSLRLLSFEAKTGKEIASVEIFQQDASSAPRIHQKNSHASPTPIIEGDRVYVHFGHQGTACVTLDGKSVWKNRDLTYKPVHGNGGSPVIVDDALIFSCDGATDPFVVALNKNNGEIIWKTPRITNAERNFSFATPLPIEVNGRIQVVSPGSGAVCSFDVVTGEELWRVDYGQGYSVIPKPVYAHGLVFVCSGWSTPVLYAIRPDGSRDVTKTHVAWKTNKRVPNTPSLLIVEDELYMVADNGVASCLDARTGKLHWKERIGGNYSASPIFAKGKIYLQSEQGDTTVLEAGVSFKKVARSTLGERTLASVGVVDRAFLIRSDRHLYRIEGR
ncbi:MAG: serine/threonine protein kinase [Planctomycetaceae bacterium]|nr:serine/threonine protein kinase [Planctomycetaceae bacterium]